MALSLSFQKDLLELTLGTRSAYKYRNPLPPSLNSHQQWTGLHLLSLSLSLSLSLLPHFSPFPLLTRSAVEGVSREGGESQGFAVLTAEPVWVERILHPTVLCEQIPHSTCLAFGIGPHQVQPYNVHWPAAWTGYSVLLAREASLLNEVFPSLWWSVPKLGSTVANRVPTKLSNNFWP